MERTKDIATSIQATTPTECSSNINGDRKRCERTIERLRNQPPKYSSDVWDCERCGNIGALYSISEWTTPSGKTVYDVQQKECSCMNIRRAIKEFGVDFRKYTFEKFETPEEWQQRIKAVAQDFAKDENAKMLFMGGMSGAGKSHLCTAAFTELLKAQDGKYISWVDTIRRLKAAIFDEETYYSIMKPLQTAEVLYIDDFFKPINGAERTTMATEADVRIAYEIINYRYNKRLKTIISSECYITDIMHIDEATGGRIAEMATQKYLINIQVDSSKNYRRKGIEYL